MVEPQVLDRRIIVVASNGGVIPQFPPAHAGCLRRETLTFEVGPDGNAFGFRDVHRFCGLGVSVRLCCVYFVFGHPFPGHEFFDAIDFVISDVRKHPC